MINIEELFNATTSSSYNKPLELILVENENVINFWHLQWGRNYTIGRNLDNDIVIYETTISKYHAVLTMDKNDGPYLTDLGSLNGTKINECKIGEKIGKFLKENDKIKLGENLIYLLLKRIDPSFKHDEVVDVGSRFKVESKKGINIERSKKSKKVKSCQTLRESLQIIRSKQKF